MKVDCKWSKYGNWSNCNASCGAGTEYRTRTVTQKEMFGGSKCLGNDTEFRKCNHGTCSGKICLSSKAKD